LQPEKGQFQNILIQKVLYAIKEIYYTLQGEGAHTGRPAIFCRFSGCNLWTGREIDRPKAICQFCDTDFWGTDGVNGGKYATADDLALAVKQLWKKDETGKDIGTPYVVCTGGEPLLQLDDVLIAAFHQQGLEIGIETNGTKEAPDGIDWICVSPKANTDLVLTKGNELKLVYPQPTALPHQFEHLDFEHFYLQPMDGPEGVKNTQLALDYCLKNPKWNLSVQTHKLLNIP
jgi:7-carboxy-7-deazaguanine synthase (Cx14CxxC type)